MPQSPSKAPRRHDLDALRGVAMVMGIVLHGVLAYIAGTVWAVRDPEVMGLAGLIFSWIHGFRMHLFFWISGFFTAMLWSLRGPRKLLAHRAKRILLPLFLGCLTIIPALLGVSYWSAQQRAPFSSILGDPTADEIAGLSAWTAQGYAVQEEREPGSGISPLNLAISRGHTEQANWFIERKKGLDDSDRSGLRPVHMAALVGNATAFEGLVRAGADLSAEDGQGNTVARLLELPEAESQARLGGGSTLPAFDEVEEGRQRVALTLQGVNAGTESTGGSLAERWKIMADKGASLSDVIAGVGMTPLMVSLSKGDDEAVAWLLSQGIDTNIRTKDGSTALHFVMLFGLPQWVEPLIEAGADPNVINSYGDGPLGVASVPDQMSSDLAASIGGKLSLEGLADRRGIVSEALVAAGADPSGAGVAGLLSALMTVPIWHHLWFLWILWWLCLAWLAGGAVAKAFGLSLPDHKWGRGWRIWLWILPLTILPDLAMRGWGAVPGFGPDTSVGLIPMPHVMAYYGVFFLVGGLTFLWTKGAAVARPWKAQLLTATLLFPFALSFGLRLEWVQGFAQIHLVATLLEVGFAWLMVFGCIGLFQAWFTEEKRWARYLSDSSYWLYLAHLPLVIGLQGLFIGISIGAAAKSVLVMGISFVLLMISYEWGVRYTVIGRLLNGPRTRKAAPSNEAAA